MTRISETTSQMKQSNTAAADLGVQLGFDPNDSPADGQTPNGAIAKVTLDNLLKQGYGVLLKITTGSASFQNADPGTNGKAITLTTGAMGRVTANFTDTVAEQDNMTATVVTGPGGSPIANGPSDTKPYVFAPAISDVYGLGLKALVDGASANGKSADQGEAIVTDNGGSLASPVIVRFEFTQGAAKFVLTGDTNIQPGSTEQVLYVKTHSENGNDIAKASFTDSTAAGETVTLKASLPDHPEVQPATLDFSFQALALHNYAIVLIPQADNARADGKWDNLGRVLITDNGVNATAPVVVKCEFTRGSAHFDLSTTTNVLSGSTDTILYVNSFFGGGLDFADVFFTDTVTEVVTLKVSLRDYPAVTPQTHDFTFTPNHPIQLYATRNNARAYSDECNSVLASVGDSPGTVVFTLPASSSASFVDSSNPKSKEVTVINGLADASFTSIRDEDVTLTATLKDGPLGPGQLAFTFRSETFQYDLSINMSGYAGTTAGTNIYFSGLDQGRYLVRASLPLASSATFPAQQTGSYWMINPKLCEAHIQTATVDQITRWVDVVNADGVAVCACAIDVPTKASVANVSG
jgi:hypothetical protein